VTAVNVPSTSPSTIPQHALDGLRRAIVAGELRPGERVGQEEVAERLGVSIAPVREALRILEQEGQVTYLPRRGYFVTTLRIPDLEEIYDLRRLLEERAARHVLPTLDADAIDRIELAARDCVDAAEAGDVTAELEANRRFHFAILEAPEQVHTMRIIRLLWDSTEAYRAMYYNAPEERRASIEAHDRILGALRDRDADRLVAELDAHRRRAIEVLRQVLAEDPAKP
jgi:DNA-binding GntR family transcriptional regulator